MEVRSGELLLDEQSKCQGSHSPGEDVAQLREVREVGEELECINGPADIQLKYYLEFRKIYFTAFKLTSELNKQAKLRDSLAARASQIEAQLTALHKSKREQEPEEQAQVEEADSKRKGNKRTRRTAEQIQRKFYCGAEFCDRCYGSQGSLQQHIKLKHPELYKRDYEEP